MSLTLEELKWATILALTEPPQRQRFTQIESIRLIKPPDKLEYDDGELIDYTGMIIVYVDASGNILGIVPFSRLRFPVQNADIDESPEIIYTNGIGLNALYVPKSVPAGSGRYYYDGILGRSGAREFTVLSNLNTGPGVDLITIYDNPPAPYSGPEVYAMNLSGYRGVDLGEFINGSCVYIGYTTAKSGIGKFEAVSWKEYWNLLPHSTNIDSSSITTKSGTQTIPVEWVRPSDGEVITVSFDISVIATADL